MTLEQFFSQHTKAALGFSGGVDSSYLLYAAQKYGADIKPYFIKTAFQPAFELDDAERVARITHTPLEIVECNVMGIHDVTRNDKMRCYHCKKILFATLKNAARLDGYELLLDGSNASDDTGDRPGMQAAAELGVRSPLRECGLSKSDIRRLSQEAGLFTWDKPAYACLATRIPTGTAITKENLEKVEKAEAILYSLGFRDFRIRLLDGLARIQLPAAQMGLLLSKRAEILEKLSGFEGIMLDLSPRGE